MAGSQNALCSGSDPVDSAAEHPPGLRLAVSLAESLQGQGFRCTQPDNWRDIGWAFSVGPDGETVLASLSQIESRLWMVQVAGAPEGILPAMFRRSAVRAGATRAFRVAQALHPQLLRHFPSVLWAIDTLPAEGVAQPAPVDPDAPSP